MQVFSHTYELNDLLDSDKYKQRLNRCPQAILLLEWDKLRQMMWSENCTIAPNGFVQSVQKVAHYCDKELFTGFAQNDLPEFLMFISECFHKALHREADMKIRGNAANDQDKVAVKCFEMVKTMYQKEYSELIKLFYGIAVSEIASLKGESYSINPEPFNLLNLPIPGKRNATLYDCFDAYTKDELMDGDNAWMNEKTGCRESVNMSIKFWMLPEVLVIDLKRFNNMVRKNSQLVTFPLENLDLSKYVRGYNKNSYVYDLYGVCNHHGLGTQGGHYTSYVKTIDNKWYHFNDTDVKPVADQAKIVSSQAYCFFYRKKN